MKPEDSNNANRLVRNLNLLRLTLAATLILHALGLYAFLLPVYADGLLLTSRRWMLITALGIAGFVVELALLAAALFAKKPTLRKTSHRLIQSLSRLKSLNLVFYLLLFALCSILIFAPIYGRYIPGFITILLAYWLTALAGSLFLKSWGTGLTATNDFNRSWPEYLGFSLLLTTFGFRILLALQDISAYPFTLGWSETSRYYYASLFFSEKLYGLDIPPTVLHPTRYLMQAVPFLAPGLPIWLHRAWQVFLWVGTTLLTSWMLLRRLAIVSHWNRALLFITSFLFLLIGPVYYHLQIPLILVLWGFRTGPANHPWLRFLKSFIAVAVASAWAGISRVNWYPLPGLLAACLYLLEKPMQGIPVQAANAPLQGKKTLRSMAAYLIEPAAWTILGMTVAFAANTLYIRWSGNPAEQFTTSFSSSLLWYRLLPSSTYLPGILLGALITSLPFVYLIWERLNVQTGWRQFHPLRLLVLSAVLLVFFAGGLVVSIKIGGGSNLHNMDAYQALLWIIASMIFFGKFVSEDASAAPITTSLTVSRFWAALSIGIIVFFSFLDNAVRPPLPGRAATDRGLAIISQRAAEAHQNGGEVLFISNRHLLTFGYIPGVPLFPDYERVFLMEMAMAGDTEYLGRLRQDLADGRFSLIITEPLYVRIKDESADFGEENNIWVKQVVRLLRCYYIEDENDDDEKFMLRELQIQFLTPDPKPNPARCPKE